MLTVRYVHVCVDVNTTSTQKTISSKETIEIGNLDQKSRFPRQICY